MPGELDELYRQTLERIRNQAGDDGELGMRILSWITHARRPLSVDELRYGLAVEYKDDDDDDDFLQDFDQDNLLSSGSLVDVCAGLVIIDSTSQIIRLVHYTTQEYFDKERLHLFGDAEIDLSRACLTYSFYKTVTEFVTLPLSFEEAHTSHPFLDYAAHHWFSHLRSSVLSANPAPALLRAVARLKSSDKMLFLTNLLQMPSKKQGRAFFLDEGPESQFDHSRITRTSPLEIASYLGVEELVAVLLDRRTGSCPDTDTSLVFAASKGHLNVVKLLLSDGVRVDSTVKIESLCAGTITALSAACKVGHLPVVKALIKNGADIHGQALATLPPLHAAIAGGNPDLVHFLLKEGVNINCRDSTGQTACHMVARYYSDDMMKILLDAHCELELTDHEGWSALHRTASNTSFELIELLLDRGADASTKNVKGETARNLLEQQLSSCTSADLIGLIIAYGSEHSELAQQLIQRLLQLEQKSVTSAIDDPDERNQLSPTLRA